MSAANTIRNGINPQIRLTCQDQIAKGLDKIKGRVSLIAKSTFGYGVWGAIFGGAIGSFFGTAVSLPIVGTVVFGTAGAIVGFIAFAALGLIAGIIQATKS